ncbi:MAG: hypothetical protein R3B13_04810 [Polyangiaceae bacterium]
MFIQRCLLLLAGASLAACTYDYDRFDELQPDASATGGNSSGGASSGGASGASGAGTGGTAGSGGIAGGTGGGASGGSAGTGGSAGGCGANQKACGQSCVSTTDPNTGCAASSCDPCPSANGVASCQSGQCALTCNVGFLDCNTQASDGCEHSTTSPTIAHCGGCGNDCSTLGFSGGFACSGGICGCTSAAQCKAAGGVGTATCDGNGACTCDGSVCQHGETCVKQGPSLVCTCNGGAACAAGTTCCVVPAGCRNLSNDNSNCGGCGVKCPTGKNCVSGSCQ